MRVPETRTRSLRSSLKHPVDGNWGNDCRLTSRTTLNAGLIVWAGKLGGSRSCRLEAIGRRGRAFLQSSLEAKQNHLIPEILTHDLTAYLIQQIHTGMNYQKGSLNVRDRTDTFSCASKY